MYINADVGETPKDKEFLPFLQIANIACGAHAGDEKTMQQRIKLAQKHQVQISAHIAYCDRKNFGRKSIFFSKEELKPQLLQQLQRLDKICQKNQYPLSYVKPHGALYNDIVKNEETLQSVMEVIAEYNPKLQWIFFASEHNQKYIKITQNYNLQLCFEAFADRQYEKGLLMDRKKTKAVIDDPQEIIRRFFLLQEQGSIVDENGQLQKLQVQTICFHGDNPASLEAIKKLSLMT